MSKQVTLTPEITERIRRAIGDAEFDTSNLAVFEARSLTTEPLKKGGFFNKARVSASTLKDMEIFLNKEGGAIPIHIMHETELLPVGKVFYSKSRDMDNGETELISQFYVPKTEAAIIDKIETSVVDEVSVGMLNTHAFCSECGFDYFGSDATWINFMDLECNEGHNIGIDGVHIRLVGIDDWAELSLVGSGAAKNAKILPRAKQTLSKENLERLAASGRPFEARLLTASYKMSDTSNEPGDPDMDLKELLAELSTMTKEAATLTAKSESDAAAIKSLEDQVAQLKADLEKAKADLSEAQTDIDAEAVKKEAEEAKAELSAAVEKLTPHVKAALVASGEADATVPTTLSEMVETVEAKGLKLHQAVVANAGASETKDQPAKQLSKFETARLNAYKA